MAGYAPRKPETTPRAVIESFGQATTAHGVSRIIEATSHLSRLFWAAVALVALCLFCVQCGILVHTFFQYPYTTKLDIITRPSLQFPAVTICNTNKLRRSQLMNTAYEDLIKLDGAEVNGGYEDPEYDWWFNFPSSFYDFASTSDDDSDTTIRPTSPSLHRLRRKRFISSDQSAQGLRQNADRTGEKVRVPRQAESSSSSDESLFWPSELSDFEFYNYYDFGDVEENDWNGFHQSILETGDFSKWSDIIIPTKKEVERMGHQGSDFIPQCSFDKKKCSAKDFYKFQNNMYGNCFVFNHAGNMTEPKDTGKTGAQHGLHLTLFVEQPEYVGLLTHETGARVRIHDPYLKPYPEDDGFTVPTGVSSSIGVRQIRIKRLSHPHGDCSSGTGSDFNSSEFTYSERACRKHCFQNYLMRKCGCVTDIGMEKPLCSVVNKTQQSCKQRGDTLSQENRLPCDCPTPCTEREYRITASSSTWPSERFEPHLVQMLSVNNSRIEQILRNVSLTRKNLLELKIYFEELNYESIEQTPLYTVEGLLGGVGGLLGLYIGLSLITVFEIGVFIFQFLHAVFNKRMNRHQDDTFSGDNSVASDQFESKA